MNPFVGACSAFLLLTLASPALAQDAKLKELVAALQKLDAGLHPAGSEQAKELADSVRKGLVTLRHKINEKDVQAWRKIQSKKDWESFRNARLSKLSESLYDNAPKLFAPVEPTPVHVTRTIPGEGFVVENLLYESRPNFSQRRSSKTTPGLWVAANLYRPEPMPKTPMPAIIIIHSHHNPKTQGELQDMGMTWARLGCCVLVPDMLGHGER